MQAQEQVQVVRVVVRTAVRAAGWPAGSVESTAVGTAGSAAASAASPGAVAVRLPCRSEQQQQDQHSWNDAQLNLQKNHPPEQSE